MNLLFPNGKEAANVIPAETYHDLAIDELVDMLSLSKKDHDIIRGVFSVMPDDPDTVLYRQEILSDLIANREFCDELGSVLSRIDVLKEYNANRRHTIDKKATLLEVAEYMSEMDVYIDVVDALTVLFEKHAMKSRGLREMAALLSDVVEKDKIEELKKYVASLKADVSTLRSVTVGVNLSSNLYPEEVKILDYNPFTFNDLDHNRRSALMIAGRGLLTV